MFFVTRLGVELLTPLNLSIISLLLAFLLLLFRKLRCAAFFLFTGIFVLVIGGYGVGIRPGIYTKESLYPPLLEEQILDLKQQGVRYIAVLGSGHVSDPQLPATSQIGGTSLFRLVEAVRIHNLVEGSKIIISGGIGYDPVPNARIVSAVATKIGVDKGDIIIEDTPRDTMQEAEVIKKTVGDAPFILVTSAFHMPRAMEIFRARGLHPVPAPTDYIIRQYHNVSPADVLPNAGNLSLTKRVAYEKLGTIWKNIKTIIEKYQS